MPANDERAEVPLSEREQPRTIVDGGEGSYTTARLNNDYKLFLENRDGYDPSKSTEEKQKDLFKLFEAEEVDDVGQAWEWWLGKKWDSWSDEDLRFAIQNSPEDAKAHLQMLSKGRYKAYPYPN